MGVCRIQENLATQKVMNENRKRQMIAEMVSRTRFKAYVQDDENNYDDEQDGKSDNESIIISPLEQLIALRRISLLFMDYFDKLDIETHSRMWEKLIIVLHNDSQHSASERKKRRRKQGGESGFKFSVTDDEDDRVVTATVPIDFLDEEILHDFERNMEDIYVLDEEFFHY